MRRNIASEPASLDVQRFDRKQLAGDDPAGPFRENAFFEACAKLFNTPIDMLIEGARQHIPSFTPDLADFLVEQLLEPLQKLAGKLQEETGVVPDLAFYIGPGAPDGHAVLLNGRPVVFYDLTAAKDRKDRVDWESYATHEYLHGIHYALRPTFYPGDYADPEDVFFKRLAAEGAVTHLTKALTGATPAAIYWFNLLDERLTLQWIETAQRFRRSAGFNLQKAILEDRVDVALHTRLFSSAASMHLHESRLGYYYGAQVARELDKGRGAAALLQLPYRDWRRAILSYFDS